MPGLIQKAEPLWKPSHQKSSNQPREITSDKVISRVSLAGVPLIVIKTLMYAFKKASTLYD